MPSTYIGLDPSMTRHLAGNPLVTYEYNTHDTVPTHSYSNVFHWKTQLTIRK